MEDEFEYKTVTLFGKQINVKLNFDGTYTPVSPEIPDLEDGAPIGYNTIPNLDLNAPIYEEKEEEEEENENESENNSKESRGSENAGKSDSNSNSESESDSSSESDNPDEKEYIGENIKKQLKSKTPVSISSSFGITVQATKTKDTRTHYTFQQRVEQLENFSLKHGHMRVGKTNPGLSNWISKIRDIYNGNRPGLLTPTMIKSLELLGFQWEKQSRTSSFEEILRLMKEYKQTFGHLHIQPKFRADKHWKRLVNWLYNRKYPRRHPTAYQLTELDRIGFDVNFFVQSTPSKISNSTPRRSSSVKLAPSKDQKFENNIAQLKEFKKIHGHLKVPHKDPWKSLHYFVNNVRASRKLQKGINITPERIRTLDEVGFEW